jgi:ABC-type uncharacterized transport system substrate-binding protein
LIVSSYHREYIWTQETNKGLCDVFLKFGYFDNKEQVQEFTKNDHIETSKFIINKLWLDSKRKSEKTDIANTSSEIYKIALNLKPDIILLGDDNAVNYVGNSFKDKSIPIVFWGVNSSPLKYGLVESIEKPGHNVTGTYQPGFFVEGFQLLKKIVPTAQNFAIISDASETGRSNYKMVEYLTQNNMLPLKLVDFISTDDFELWKEKALEFQNKADAIFIGHYASLKDKNGSYVPPEQVMKWYIANIHKPDMMSERQFVVQGILCTADDSGYQQGYEAGLMVNDILYNNADPATYPIRIPKRGALIVNRKRAQLLGIALTDNMGIEEYIDTISGYDDAK